VELDDPQARLGLHIAAKFSTFAAGLDDALSTAVRDQ